MLPKTAESKNSENCGSKVIPGLLTLCASFVCDGEASLF